MATSYNWQNIGSWTAQKTTWTTLNSICSTTISTPVKISEKYAAIASEFNSNFTTIWNILKGGDSIYNTSSPVWSTSGSTTYQADFFNLTTTTPSGKIFAFQFQNLQRTVNNLFSDIDLRGVCATNNNGNNSADNTSQKIHNSSENYTVYSTHHEPHYTCASN